MIISSEQLSRSELRARLNELRDQLAGATRAYHSAKAEGRPDEVIDLLRRRSSLTQQLFRIQSELLLSFRSEPS